METQKTVRATALMTAPRYEAVYARNFIELALKEAGIPLTVSGGVFYGQCMQTMMQNVIEGGTDYILTVDFDSMFTKKHIDRLLSIIVSEDDIDAIAAVQPKRGTGELLAAKAGGMEVKWDGYPIQVDTMHFGLTVIDAKKLAEVPRPWFWSTPNDQGDWDDGKLDDDIYFWKNWKDNGMTAFVDPGSRLGHLEEMVTYFDENMKLKTVYPKDWAKERECTITE